LPMSLFCIEVIQVFLRLVNFLDNDIFLSILSMYNISLSIFNELLFSWKTKFLALDFTITSGVMYMYVLFTAK